MVNGSRAEGADGEYGSVGGVRRQGMARHSVSLVQEALDQLNGNLRIERRLAARSRAGEDPVELGEEQGDGPAELPIVGPVDVPFEQVLDFLLPAPAFGRVGRALWIQAQEDGIAVGEELLNRLVGSEGDVFALVILDDQLESGWPVIEPQGELGFGQGAGHRLARLDLGDLLGRGYSAVRGSAAAIRRP